MSLLQNILKIFPVNDEWLMLGKGEPFNVDADKLVQYYYKNGEKDKESIDTDINERFKEIRLDKGLSQVLFANEMHMTKDMVASIETNRQNVSIAAVKRLAKKFNVSELWMLYGEGDKYKLKDRKKGS